MGKCIILNDKTVGEILTNLSRDEIIDFRTQLAKCLQDYSTSSERQYQPSPSSVHRENGQKILFRPFTSPSSIGLKLVVHPKDGSALRGVVTLVDEGGLPTGFLGAEELTGFRTTMNAMILYAYRRNTANVVIFGAGMQGLWHMRLALALRGREIQKITIVNRSHARASQLIQKIKKEDEEQWRSSARFSCIDSSAADYEENLKRILGEADVVFAAVPSKQPLFPVEYLLGDGTRKRNCYVSGVGSWSTDMIELGDDLLQEAGAQSAEYNPKTNSDWGVIVDDREGVFTSSGEFVKNNIAHERVAEVGEVLQAVGHATGKDQENLVRWLEEGLIVYKSIGVSVTDLVTGEKILQYARAQGRGQYLTDF